MKYLLAIALLIATQVNAKTEPAYSKADCEAIATLAETVMAKRQENADLMTMVKLANGNVLAEGIIMEAYDKPRFITDDAKHNAVQDFKNGWFRECTTFNQ